MDQLLYAPKLRSLGLDRGCPAVIAAHVAGIRKAGVQTAFYIDTEQFQPARHAWALTLEETHGNDNNERRRRQKQVLKPKKGSHKTHRFCRLRRFHFKLPELSNLVNPAKPEAYLRKLSVD
jgi:hypothetical protein